MAATEAETGEATAVAVTVAATVQTRTGEGVKVKGGGQPGTLQTLPKVVVIAITSGARTVGTV